VQVSGYYYQIVGTVIPTKNVELNIYFNNLLSSYQKTYREIINTYNSFII